MLNLDLGFIQLSYNPPVIALGNVQVDLAGAYIIWQMLNNANQNMQQITQQINAYTITLGFNPMTYKFELSINGHIVELSEIEVYVLAHYLGRLINFGIFVGGISSPNSQLETSDEIESTDIQTETLNQPEIPNQYNDIQQKSILTNETNSNLDVDLLIEKFKNQVTMGSYGKIDDEFKNMLKQIAGVIPPDDTLVTYFNQVNKVILGEIPVVFNEETVATVQDENIKQILAQLLTKYNVADSGMKKIITGLVYFIERLITFKSLQGVLGSALPS